MKKIIQGIFILMILNLSACSIEVAHHTNMVNKDSLICSGGIPMEQLSQNTELYNSYTHCIMQLEKNHSIENTQNENK
jgi:hypothetical protein